MRWQETSLGQRLLQSLGLPGNVTKEQANAFLERKAATLDFPIFAQHMVAGSLTWEQRVTLATTDSKTAAIPMRFNRSVLLVGFIFELTGTSFGVAAPELKEVDCQIRLPRENNGLSLTARENSPTSTGPSGFVPLSALDTSKRLFMRIFDDNDGTIEFVFQGRYATSNSSGFTNPVSISAIALAKPLDGP
jgi:hypothetical protein